MDTVRALKQLFFPAQCLSCHSFEVTPTEAPLCSTCQLSFEPISHLLCHRCGEPSFEPVKNKTQLCERCHRKLPSFESARAAFWHEGSVLGCIHHFKYEDAPQLAAPLAHLASSRFLRWYKHLERPLLVPIPMHDSRFRERKYDQACLFAKALAQRSHGELAESLLKRVQATPKQVGLDEREREKNLEHAFFVTKKLDNRPIVLIDDVYTTGATMRAAAMALRTNGAHDVYAFTLARAMRFLPFAKNKTHVSFDAQAST